ncbi:hypothetical protein M899_1742 [Bacteriovorax sp. BSW11_IV]|uniref:hypothetical protein n=1 Tax=Bacteriovorax sp. BSW11_IV TaxID=1353529 RepID=UPI00038A2409|nr:hypothetical protein [Bacteriovorax sp. BSW11_IV]EQC49275.1 hypothetical protein M899_1742 [Bacteriovorax sp. BSW11_IV]
MLVSGLIKFAFFYLAFVVIKSLISSGKENANRAKQNARRAPSAQPSSSDGQTFEAEYRVIK